MTRIDAKFADLKTNGKKAFVAYVMAGDLEVVSYYYMVWAVFLPLASISSSWDCPLPTLWPTAQLSNWPGNGHWVPG